MNGRMMCLAGLLILLGPGSGAKSQDLLLPSVNLLDNGGFEEGPPVERRVNLEEDATTIKGWTVTRGPIGLLGEPAKAAQGRRCLDLHGASGFGGIKQSFVTTKDRKYRLTFALSAGVKGGEKKVGVRAAGQKASFLVKGQPAALDQLTWTTQTWDFTAAAEETILEIHTLMVDDPQTGPLLDDVRVVFYEAPVTKEERERTKELNLLRVAEKHFQDENFILSEFTLDEFLKKYPQSPHVPRAKFQIAAALVLREQREEADAAFRDLVTNHPQSPWTRLVQQSIFDEGQIWKLAEDSRKTALARQDAASGQFAADTYRLYQQRFIPGKKKAELLYKIGECSRIAGKMEDSKKALQAVVDEDKTSRLGKLAALHLGELDQFTKSMEELFQEAEAEDECYHAFLFLAEKYLPRLSRDDQGQCLYFKARLLDLVKERRGAATELFAKIVKDHPKTTWATEAAFWLAELAYRDGKFVDAKTAYLELAKNYPDHPRAAQAKRFAQWIDGQEQSRPLLEKITEYGLKQLLDPDLAFAGTWHNGVDDPAQMIKVTLAYRRPDQVRAQLIFQGSEIFLAVNEEGTWYRLAERNQRAPLVHSPSKDYSPLDFLKLGGVQVVGFNSGGQNAADFWQGTLSGIQPNNHVQVLAHRKDRKLLKMQSLNRRAEEVLEHELIVEENGRLVEMRQFTTQEGKRVLTWVLEDIRLGTDVPKDFFRLQPEKGDEVREVDRIDFYDASAQALRVLAGIIQHWGLHVDPDAKKGARSK